MVHRTPWLLALALASCHAPPASLPAGPVDGAVPQSLYATSILFEPALPAAGTLSIAHESGWSLRCAAQPSGVDVRIPEGPASVILRLNEQVYERTIKVTQAANEFVWRWRPRP